MAGARGDHISQRAVLREHIEHLLGAGRDGKAHIWVHGFALEDRGHFEHIEQGGIRTGADADLVNLDRANLRYTLDIIRAVRAWPPSAQGRRGQFQSPRHTARLHRAAARSNPARGPALLKMNG